MTPTNTFEELTALVEQEMADVLAERAMPLYDMMSYHLGWEGDQDRPISSPRARSHGVACLLACSLAGGDRQTALPAAAAVEMVASFSQIHDDVQDGNPKRGDRDSVWWVWGPAQAINAGDGMHALARLALLRLQGRGVSSHTSFRAAQVLDQACLEMCEGRFRDLELVDRIDTSQEAYFEMASGKTGALMDGAMRLGALVASADDATVGAFGKWGRNAGIAMQVQRDLNELWPPGSGDVGPSAAVLSKAKLLPVVYAVQEANINDKRRLGEVYFKRVLEARDVDAIRDIVERLGGRRYCEDRVREYAASAEQALVDAGLPRDAVDTVTHLLGSLLEGRQAG